LSCLNAWPSWKTMRAAGTFGSYCAGTYTQYVCWVPGKTAHGRVNGPRTSPRGTPSCGSESGPSRYCESGFGAAGGWAAACARAATATPNPTA
jgi:hypothetical protein